MSGVKKLMHKIKEKMESVGDGHSQDKDSHMAKVGGLVKMLPISLSDFTGGCSPQRCRGRHTSF